MMPIPAPGIVESERKGVAIQPTPSQAVDPTRATSEFLRLIPRDFAREHLVLSRGRVDDTEQLAVSKGTDPEVIFNVGVRLDMPVEAIVCDDEAIARTIDAAYERQPRETSNGASFGDLSQESREIEQLIAEADRDLLSTQGKGPIVRLVDAFLFEALGHRASDVHVQPLADRALVRYRLDGVLHTVREIPPKLIPGVISRIKVMGRMDIAERRAPQDGRATVTIGSRPVDLRISTLPTSYGERAVIRLLDNNSHLCDFDKLGMPPEVTERYLERAQMANGIILLTGPTGSGKTTTLYATLRRIGSDRSNIMTIEDPIEYELSSVGLPISQSQVNLKKGVTFATGLRHILRQDPDVIMVGEIRDTETARIAIQSSLTGHLVFSTLHTNDAPSAVTRLIDLGIEPYLVSVSLSAVLAQRLVRTTHQACDGQGCESCFQSGYLARTGLFELLVLDEGIRDLVNRNSSLREIREAGRAGDLRTLGEHGEELIEAGVTTRLEVQRVVEGVQ